MVASVQKPMSVSLEERASMPMLRVDGSRGGIPPCIPTAYSAGDAGDSGGYRKADLASVRDVLRMPALDVYRFPSAGNPPRYH